MAIELDIGHIITIALACMGGAWALVRYLDNKQISRMDLIADHINAMLSSLKGAINQRFDDSEKARQHATAQWENVFKILNDKTDANRDAAAMLAQELASTVAEMTQMKVELSRNYLRRDELTAIEARLAEIERRIQVLE